MSPSVRCLLVIAVLLGCTVPASAPPPTDPQQVVVALGNSGKSRLP